MSKQLFVGDRDAEHALFNKGHCDGRPQWALRSNDGLLDLKLAMPRTLEAEATRPIQCNFLPVAMRHGFKTHSCAGAERLVTISPMPTSQWSLKSGSFRNDAGAVVLFAAVTVRMAGSTWGRPNSWSRAQMRSVLTRMRSRAMSMPRLLSWFGELELLT